MTDHFSHQIFSLLVCTDIEYSFNTNTDTEVMSLVWTHTQYTFLTFFPRWGYSVLATWYCKIKRIFDPWTRNSEGILEKLLFLWARHTVWTSDCPLFVRKRRHISWCMPTNDSCVADDTDTRAGKALLWKTQCCCLHIFISTHKHTLKKKTESDQICLLWNQIAFSKYV